MKTTLPTNFAEIPPDSYQPVRLAAEYLSCSTGKIHLMMKERRLGYRKLDKVCRVKWADVLRVAAAAAVEAISMQSREPA